MWISRIALTNWRAYGQAVFEIPRPDTKSNVVIIGAKNGVGKTSLLEAVTLCLFGIRGLGNLGRGNETVRRNELGEYRDFMREVFHRAADLSSPKSSVSLSFMMEGGSEVVVERVWHFGADGEYQEDELRVRENGEELSIPPLADSRDAVLSGYIAQNFLPVSLSPFYLFDSVRVQHMARRDMKDQVRNGIEGTLGIPIIRELITDLHDYASMRRTQGMAGRASDSKLQALRLKIENAEAEAAELAKESKDLATQLERARADEDALLLKFHELGGEDVARIGDLRQKSGELRQARVDLKDKLAKSLVGDFAMSLIGSSALVNKAAVRLRMENARTEWERDKKSGAEKYDKFLANLDKLDALSLPMSDAQVASLRKNLKAAWDEVWFPMPSNCAETFLNSGFSDDERAAAIARLEEVSTFSIAEVRGLLESIARNEAEIGLVDRQIANVRGDRTEDVQKLHDQMKEKRVETEQLGKQMADVDRKREGVEKELARVRPEFGREMSQRKGTAPILNRSVCAEKVVGAIEGIISQAYSHHVKEIAEEMTAAYVSMARKQIISKIRISEDCDIKLLTERGKDIRETLVGHGETQIFTLALIAAIARVSKNQFPFIIDTPLANLDRQHRREFLRYFSAEMDNQILLLSTNEEIREEQMALLRRRVACKFLIEQEHHDGIARNVVRQGQYFEEVEE